MRTIDSERRAWLRSLKPRIVEVQALVAEQAGRQVSQSEIDADIADGIAEYRKQLPPRKRHAVLHEG